MLAKLSKHGLAAVLLVCICAQGAFAANVLVPKGAGQVVFGDLPVTPGSYPDYSPSRFALKGNPKVIPQSFNYGSPASPPNVLVWYLANLRKRGWQIDGVRTNYPAPRDAAIQASRKGESVTVVIEYAADGGSRVSLIKLNASR